MVGAVARRAVRCIRRWARAMAPSSPRRCAAAARSLSSTRPFRPRRSSSRPTCPRPRPEASRPPNRRWERAATPTPSPARRRRRRSPRTVRAAMPTRRRSPPTAPPTRPRNRRWRAAPSRRHGSRARPDWPLAPTRAASCRNRSRSARAQGRTPIARGKIELAGSTRVLACPRCWFGCTALRWAWPLIKFAHTPGTAGGRHFSSPHRSAAVPGLAGIEPQ
mmetsp:Transcript_44527/g.110341  ORF Transcript_44527/g.110341 Transcript_44527/m.110341 type:complete len:220 (-) Transcript_44527:50-709(-)